jgi:hypothetical protein
MSECNHMTVARYVFSDTQAPVDLWACTDCYHKFFPASKHFAVEAERDQQAREVERLREALRQAGEEPNLDRARAIADAVLGRK